ncbi:hypothetical protein [Clostridium perfringens]|uniref:hypothetical protein n=1 Tax=Clostridium perfringens TaxID=1502 RepID=UPI001CAE0EB7|nr:hypothetical protein [Clostridium perfringens]HBI6990316.1 hypothetical protein [Clostridium perfringens]HBI6993133.1 hypothetical protein [Clostridium perfringens]HBI6999151.1 hypothetical protein [Clostridium perfringens]HBI7025811.1 hypothetical protein [Clostridium perfringens]HBI7059261.1 hypothetical protein [Clostridium perfringens]
MDDITYCTNKICNRQYVCNRHESRLKDKKGEHSFACFKCGFEKDNLKQAIDNLVNELNFEIMQNPETKSYLVNGALEIIESEFKLVNE